MTISLDHANATADHLVLSPDMWIRDLGKSLRNCIDSSAPIEERASKMRWLDAVAWFPGAVEARQVLEQFEFFPVYYGTMPIDFWPPEEAQPVEISPSLYGHRTREVGVEQRRRVRLEFKR